MLTLPRHPPVPARIDEFPGTKNNAKGEYEEQGKASVRVGDACCGECFWREPEMDFRRYQGGGVGCGGLTPLVEFEWWS